MPDSVGNSLSTALGISLSPSQSFTESVEAGDLDFYRFSLGSASTGVTLTLTGLTADANLELLNAAGTPVSDSSGPLVSTNGGSLIEAINTVLGPGTYYIRVSPGPAADPANPLSTTPSTNYSLNVFQDNGIRADIVWRNSVTAESFAWFLDGSGNVASTGIPPGVGGGWDFQTASGDFNNDGNGDIVLRNFDPTSPDFGKSGVWFMNGATRLSSEISSVVIPDANWQIRGAGDFDGNGQTDWVWRNSVTGQNSIWFLNGVQPLSGPLIDSRSGPWQIQAAGDFNSDGKADIVWRNPTTGENDVWFMDGTAVIGTAPLLTVNLPGWQIRGSADYNQDGKADLLWRNPLTGENVIWFMNGTERTSDLFIPKDPIGGWQSYALSGRGVPRPKDIAGNTAAAALDLGPLNGNGLFKGTINANNPTDYYQFTLPTASRVALSLAGATGGDLAGDLDIFLSNASGTFTLNLNQTALTPQVATTSLLPSGVYNVRVLAKGAASSAYQLGLNTLATLVSNNPLTLNEGATQTISSTSLLVSDGAQSPGLITYSVLTAPNPIAGSLNLNSTVLAVGGTFTQADINAGRLTYRQSGSETPLSDSFVFRAATGSTGPLASTIPPTTFSLNFLPVNDAPQLLSTNLGVTLTEGTAIAITSTLLSATDAEQGPTQLVYSINNAPTNGTLLRSGLALTTGGTFTQAEITGNLLTYSHNGSETLNDGFTFTLTDGAGGFLTPPTRSLSISVISAPDRPVLLTNTGLTLGEGSSRLIATTLLSATDVDTLADQIVYSITSAPTNGTLFRGSLGQISTFTQADLVNGRIVYGHNGTKTNSDSFTFTLLDEQGTALPGPSGTFNIAVTGVNFTPVLATTNPRLTLTEGAIATINTSILQVTDVDSAPPQLTYTVLSAPANGSLLKFGTPLTAGQTFFQSDIDAIDGRITYQHNGSETISDAFTFTVTDQTSGRLANQTFSITVQAVSDAPVLVSNLGVSLDEGATVRIPTTLLSATDADNLASQIIYEVTSLPASGTLLQGVTPITTTFTQATLNSGLLSYRHNGSESITDTFVFNLLDGTTTVPGNTFNITINPVNDPPVLAVNTGATVTEGGVATLSDAELLVTDGGDGPSIPAYTLGTLPTSGTLLLGSTPLASGGTFSQADINTGLITYQHSGSETLRDGFTFSASDGGTGLLSLRSFTITVTPVNDPPSLTAPESITATEDTAFTFSGGNRLAVVDPDSTNLTVSLGVLEGTLNITGTGLTVTGNGTSAVTVTGAAAALNTGLSSLRYQGRANFNGADILTATVADENGAIAPKTVAVNVLAVNDTPTLVVPGAQRGLEDVPLTFVNANAITLSDVDAGSIPQTLRLAVSNGTLNIGDLPAVSFLGDTINGGSTLSLSGTAEDLQAALTSLVYQGRTNFSGTDSLTISVTDGGLPPITRSVPITLVALNDAPVFTAGSEAIVVNEDSAPYSLGWATGIGPGGGTDEQSQAAALSFLVANTNSALFTPTGQPAINRSGVLTFTLAKDANTAVSGPVNVSVLLRDNGGTLSGGVNTSEERTFTINVNPVNDAPTFVKGANVSFAEDAGPRAVAWATNIRKGPADEDGQNLLFTLETLSTTNPNLFVTAPSIDPVTGILTYETAPDANGSAVIRATLSDDGGIDNGFGGTGSDRSSQTFTITATPVNDLPVLSLPVGPLSVDEDARLAIPDITVTDADAGTAPIQLTLSVTNGTLSVGSAPTVTVTSNNSRSVTVRGSQAALTPVLSALTYQANANFAGTAGTPADSLTITASDFGATGSGATTTVSRSIGIIVNPVNDAPSLSVPTTTLTVAEDSSLAITGIRGTDVDSNSLTVTVSSTNGGLLTLGTQTAASTVTTTLTPATFNTGLTGLTYRGAANYNGPEILTVSVNDGAADPVLRTISLNVTPVNDAPVITPPTGPIAPFRKIRPFSLRATRRSPSQTLTVLSSRWALPCAAVPSTSPRWMDSRLSGAPMAPLR